MSLYDGFVESCRGLGDRPAVREPWHSQLTYGELARLTDRVRDALIQIGVAPGDRVGVHLPKTIDSVAVILGTLKAGAAYVPIDPTSPPSRAAFILADCDVRVVVTAQSIGEPVLEELAVLRTMPHTVVLETTGGGEGVFRWLDQLGAVRQAANVRTSPDMPAYLLYTSGSTGKPKGVVVSHLAAEAFVDWCRTTFGATAEDRFSSHAPFHFDLSIHDLYVSLGCGATVVLIGEELGKDPKRLAEMIETERITIWYSTPSILSLLEEHGKLDRYDCRSLRIVLFAGEVFPIVRLRLVLARWPWPRYYNLYGPTETNVCTWHEVPMPLPAEWTEPLPIGRACAHYRSLVVADDQPVSRGERGELLMSGPGVMTGYWNLPDRNAAAFFTDAEGTRWYRTGDLVTEQPDGVFLFHGRRDRMVKRRGYRIELGEIESALVRHPSVSAAAVIAKPDDASGVVIHAFIAALAVSQRPSIVDMKRFCAEELPRYMVPDRFSFLDAIPNTSTDKTDYQKLTALA